jgi:dolichyl-phosphate-mannose-protein mannosyltransferase
MPPKTPRLAVDEKGSRSRSRSRSRSPGRKPRKAAQVATPAVQTTPPKKIDVLREEERVKDNDIMNLPSLDLQLMMLLTVVATAVRLFRIQQPTSVVFDEVQ